MTTFEWLSLIGVLLGGFGVLAEKLSKIKELLVGKVSYEECAKKRDNCPCMREFNRKIQDLRREK